MNNVPEITHSIPLSLVRQFEPNPSWLFHDSELHGIDHMTRVFILQELICYQLEAEGVEVNREAVRWGSMAHDVGRGDDGKDLEHGTRTATWIRESFATELSSELMDMVTYIVHWHVPSDDEAPVMTTELKVLKDADALDRARLGDLDPQYLRTKAAKSLVKVAEELYQLSQEEKEDDAFAAVVRAGQKIGVVKTEQ